VYVRFFYFLLTCYGGTHHMYLIIREPSPPQRHQSRSRQNERDARNLGSPENRRTPAPPSSGITFNGQQYDNLPGHIVMGIRRTQTLERRSVRARGSSRGRRTTQPVLGVGCCPSWILHHLICQLYSSLIHQSLNMASPAILMMNWYQSTKGYFQEMMI